MTKTWVRLLIVVLLLSCNVHAASSNPSPAIQSESGGGRQYIADLARMIRHSDKIVVTEHSFWLDAYDVQANKSRIPSDVVYGTRELDSKQRAFFLSTIEGLDPKTQDAFPACIAEIHHSIRFFAQDQLIGKVGICFQCGQVEWDGTTATPPWSLYSGLATVISNIGLSPKRDWKRLAEEHLRTLGK